jgi:alpha-mannosidase
MTSKQFFEEVKAPFTGLNLVDMEDDQRGLLLVHNGNEGFFGRKAGFQQVLSMYDAWDESYWAHVQSMAFAFIPHAPQAHHDRLRTALDFNRPLRAVIVDLQGEKPNFPPRQSFLKLDAPNVILSAFYREHDGSPTLRIYEVDGKPADVQLAFGGDVAAAWKVNLLGDSISALKPEHESVRLTLRPREIATIKLDLVQARKQWRNLDASRNVWVESGKKERRQNPK